MRQFTRTAADEQALGFFVQPRGESGFWIVIGRNESADRTCIFTGTFADGDEALEHARGVAKAMDPFGGSWVFACEFYETDLVLAQQAADIDPDEPVALTAAGRDYLDASRPADPIHVALVSPF
jgi:hypothetical protein